MTKISIGRNELLSLLRDGGIFAGSKGAMQCLQDVRVMTKGGRIRVESANNESHVCVYGGCESDDDVQFCINAKDLSSLVSLISDETITLKYDADKKKIAIAHAHGKASLPTLDASDFPSIGKVTEGNSVTISGVTIAEWLNMASDFVEGFQNSVLSNVNLYANSTHLGVCGGSHHLIFTAKTVNSNNTSDFSICIPSATAVILSKICALYDEVSITYGKNAILIETPLCKMYTLLVDAKYPNVAPLFEKGGACEVVVDRVLLQKALKRINSQTVNGANSVTLKCTGDALHLAYADRLGFDKQLEEEVPCNGEAFDDVIVDISYFLKIVNHHNTENVYFKHDNSKVSPLVFSNIYEENSEMYLLAPLA